jgi:hypothetical protein
MYFTLRMLYTKIKYINIIKATVRTVYIQAKIDGDSGLIASKKLYASQASIR